MLGGERGGYRHLIFLLSVVGGEEDRSHSFPSHRDIRNRAEAAIRPEAFSSKFSHPLSGDPKEAVACGGDAVWSFRQFTLRPLARTCQEAS